MSKETCAFCVKSVDALADEDSMICIECDALSAEYVLIVGADIDEEVGSVKLLGKSMMVRTDSGVYQEFSGEDEDPEQGSVVFISGEDFTYLEEFVLHKDELNVVKIG